MAIPGPERDGAYLLADKVRDQQHNDETVHEQVVKAKAAQPRVTRRQRPDHVPGHQADSKKSLAVGT